MRCSSCDDDAVAALLLAPPFFRDRLDGRCAPRAVSAYWVASVAAGVSLFTVAAVLSAFGIIGRLIVG